MTFCPFFLPPLLPDLRSVDLNWKMTWFSSATSSLLHKNQHASSREIWTCLLLFLAFSLPLCLTLFQCCLFYLSAVKASQALLSFVVRNLYLPKGGISDWHRQPLSSPFRRKQCFPLPPEETAPLLSLSSTLFSLLPSSPFPIALSSILQAHYTPAHSPGSNIAVKCARGSMHTHIQTTNSPHKRHHLFVHRLSNKGDGLKQRQVKHQRFILFFPFIHLLNKFGKTTRKACCYILR